MSEQSCDGCKWEPYWEWLRKCGKRKAWFGEPGPCGHCQRVVGTEDRYTPAPPRPTPSAWPTGSRRERSDEREGRD